MDENIIKVNISEMFSNQKRNVANKLNAIWLFKELPKFKGLLIKSKTLKVLQPLNIILRINLV